MGFSDTRYRMARHARRLASGESRVANQNYITQKEACKEKHGYGTNEYDECKEKARKTLDEQDNILESEIPSKFDTGHKDYEPSRHSRGVRQAADMSAKLAQGPIAVDVWNKEKAKLNRPGINYTNTGGKSKKRKSKKSKKRKSKKSKKRKSKKSKKRKSKKSRKFRKR